MPADMQRQPGAPAPAKPGKEPTKQMEITAELVQAITDRIWAMLLHDLRVERERERFLMRAGRK